MTPVAKSRFVRLLGIGLIGLGLNGCLTSSDRPAPTTQTAEPTTVAALTPAATSTLALKPAPEPEKIYPPPSRLSGMNDQQVLTLLGEPGFKRRDDPALIWQYRTQACALDLFLYQSANGSDYRVNHFETRNRDNSAVSEKDCFVGLLKAFEKRRPG
ncbi:MAG: hypothetical protein HN377_12290 [Alphaproteobacteria bacterium]|jgi:hypothetical protein|nr:hypothetical protein [Alphaproteobacteria bacterium]MBT7942906.1 hypothetical protein [Alphaproteobacteria bacterium]